MNIARADEGSLAEARAAILEGRPLREDEVNSPLLRSWERARSVGLRPNDKVLFDRWVTVADLRRLADQHRELIQLARPSLEHLWASMSSPYSVALLTDAEGMIVDSISESRIAAPELEPVGRGRSLIEDAVGTTAPAIVALEPGVAVVRQGEHFLDELYGFDCVAAPIFDVSGSLIGVLNFTSVNLQNDPRCLSRVVTGSRSAEMTAFENAHSDFLFRVHEDGRYIGTPAQGMLLVREDGAITAASHIAKKILALPEVLADGRTNIREVFDDRSLGAIMNLTRDAQAIPVRIRTGARLFLSVQPKVSPPSRRVNADEAAIAGPTDSRYRAMLERAKKVFPHGMPVLLHGETGTGKEWFARQLHEQHRPGRPFIAINCAALAEGIAESELFGYVDGAYTGGRRGGSQGLIEQAQGGTLFLDEIGDMPLHLQTRLLRVLQERRLTRLGGREEVELDVLIVSATLRDLVKLVDEGTFREDLYYRLNGLKVVLPPLRDREDISDLIETLLKSAAPAGSKPCYLSADLKQKLSEFSWPGNIRQLQHVLKLTTLLAGPEQEITPDLLPDDIGLTQVTEPSHAASLEDMQKLEIRRCVNRHNGNLSAAARELGISRTTLYKHLRE